MAGVNNGKPKRRGRPPTGRDPSIAVRIPPDMLAVLDAYRAAEPAPHPSRSEAVRRALAAFLGAVRESEASLENLLFAFYSAHPSQIEEYGHQEGTSPAKAARADASGYREMRQLAETFYGSEEPEARAVSALLRRVVKP